MSDETGRVVVGYDGSASAQRAVDWAVDEAFRRHLPLMIVYAADYTGLVGGPSVPYPAPATTLTGGPVDTAEEWWVRVAHSAQRVGEEGAARARERNGDVEVTIQAVTGSAKRVLVEASEGATVLVVGTRGYGDLVGCLVGSVASAVAGHAHCPVVVVRGQTAGPGPDRRVVVGVDGSPTSTAALRFAAETASGSGAELVVVCAWHSVMVDSWTAAYWAGVSDETNPDNAAREAAENVAAESQKAAQTWYPDIAVVTKVGQGPPAAVILTVARDAGLIVMGARGRGSFTSLMLGSVSHGVIHDAPCPVAAIDARAWSRRCRRTGRRRKCLRRCPDGVIVRAWIVDRDPATPPGPIALRAAERDDPIPGHGEVRVQVTACGVCRTDLHLAAGDLTARRPRTVPGHEVVGIVDRLGEGSHRFALGDRVGIAWLRGTCERCRWCRSGRENLCPDALFTGWDSDGGYAEYTLVPEAYAYRLPGELDDATTAALLCGGIVGYRALRLAELPPGGRLGLYGFGASAQIVAQVALRQGATVHVLSRSETARLSATALGAASVGSAYDGPPEPLDAAILFAPAGELVPVALRALDRGGILALAGIHLSDIPSLNYQRELFYEKQVRSVTANTRADGEEFLRLAAALDVRPIVHRRPLEQAERTLEDLAADAYDGAAVLVP